MLIGVVITAALSNSLEVWAFDRIQRVDGSTITAGELDAVIGQTMVKARITGLSVVVINDAKIKYAKTSGVKNRQGGDKFTPESILYAASFTKPLFAYAFLKMVERGMFDLDKPLHVYLKKPIADYPKWADLAEHKEFERITARMILSHSSGLPILRQLYGGRLTLISEPGKRFYYSNEAINFLGFVVEEYTGHDLESVIEEFVFKPLHMNKSGMIWNKEFEKDYAVGHDTFEKVIGAEKRTSARAAGSMVTTASDYAKFVLAILKSEGLSNSTFREMLTPQIRVTSERGFGPLRDKFNPENNSSIGLAWGLGWGLFTNASGKAFFHSGHSEGWQNFCVGFPKQKLAVILMSNSDNFEIAAEKLLTASIGRTELPLGWLGF